MRIKNIEIKNFRNYPALSLKVDNDVVVISGPNAVGKTNLLESVYFSSLFKSFRDDNDFIFMKDADSAEVKMSVEKKDGEHTLSVFLSKREKVYANFLVDGVKKRRKDAQGFLATVIFDPTDVDMFSKSPEDRRKYLNMVLAQKEPVFLETIASYKKALYMKSKLLSEAKQGRGSLDSLPSWNAQLAKVGAMIVFQRKNYIKFLNQNISEVYTKISGFERPIEVEYKAIDGVDLEEIEKNLLAKMDSLRSREAVAAMCLVGPHRDDISLKSEGVFLSPFSSRGELRSQILALKILELQYLTKDDEAPILLLDDVLSELDETRRTFLLKFLQNKFQVFITTTHPLEMPAQHITLSPAVKEEQI